MEKKVDLIELEVEGINNANNTSFLKKIFTSNKPIYNLILSKKDETNKRVPIVIGEFEGQSIAIVLEKLTPKRPLIHDVFKSTVDKFNYKLDRVVITKIDNDFIFHSTIYYSDKTKTIDVDSRVSDAIALALRHNSPIYINKETFDKCSIMVKN